MNKLLIAAALAGLLGAAAAPSYGDEVRVVRTAPPPLRTEVVPDPRPGHVWVAGYWDWQRGHHVWVRGHWERERPGYVYHPSAWEERDGAWVIQRGGWGRGDRDHDGIPNRYDRDRDGDGVPNRADAAPNNPNRH